MSRRIFGLLILHFVALTVALCPTRLHPHSPIVQQSCTGSCTYYTITNWYSSITFNQYLAAYSVSNAIAVNGVPVYSVLCTEGCGIVYTDAVKSTLGVCNASTTPYPDPSSMVLECSKADMAKQYYHSNCCGLALNTALPHNATVLHSNGIQSGSTCQDLHDALQASNCCL